MKIYPLLFFVVGCWGIQWKAMNHLISHKYLKTSENTQGRRINIPIKRIGRPKGAVIGDPNMAGWASGGSSSEDSEEETVEVTATTAETTIHRRTYSYKTPNESSKEIVDEEGIAGSISGESGNDKNKEGKSSKSSETKTLLKTKTKAADADTGASHINEAVKEIQDGGFLDGKLVGESKNDEIEGGIPNNAKNGTSTKATTEVDLQISGIHTKIEDDEFLAGKPNGESDNGQSKETTSNPAHTGSSRNSIMTAVTTQTVATDDHKVMEGDGFLVGKFVDESGANENIEKIQNNSKTNNVTDAQTTSAPNPEFVYIALGNQRFRRCRIGRRRKW